ncbi:hypothetical protein [Limnoglobus roseus]|uniref:Uncharacterized protein n=1 Tax=Limnoglobus roseus TaxID=2598579 RepID=A0A5C1AA04_9BACT|nr:hypothetical protein [Limnoglobus roseus]QEL13868.1 hypothetical protein PX52LOC_00726 [Limnoglobus roseus]
MSYVLSQGTADKLKALLNTSGGSGAGASGGSNRQEGWITVTLAEDGEYEGTVNYYDAVNEVWETFASVVVLPCNEDDTLVEGRRYIGQRSGDTLEGDSIWIVSAASEVEVCCGLRIVEAEDDPTGCDPGTIVVDGGPLFGAGIAWNESECQAYLDTGCGITLEGGEKIGVHAGDLAGPGLIATTGCKLEVNPGNCVSIDDDGKVNVSLSGVFSAVTAITLTAGCPTPTLKVTTTAFSFDGCTLTADGSNDEDIVIPCCETCDPPPQEYYWCYAGSCTLSAVQPEGSVGPFATQLDCTDQCYLTPTDCHDCEFSVIINGTSYPFESFGGDGYIAAFGDGLYLYMTPPTSCEAYWLVQLYDGALEQCNWESYWDGIGCGTLAQGTNNGIQFTECPAESVELCCNGGDGGGSGGCTFGASLQFKTEGPLCGICNAFAAGWHELTPDPMASCNYYGSYGGGDIAECANDNRGYGVRMIVNDEAGTVELVAYGDYCGPPPGTYTPDSFSPFSLTVTYSTGGATCGACGETTLTITEV